ncbi:EAL domain-containing protein [Ectothiorhodospiraceae bacterium 2226]|nr:EAL domain-containing protein [Ectothiorhodospiraceae bacterium 2226]
MTYGQGPGRGRGRSIRTQLLVLVLAVLVPLVVLQAFTLWMQARDELREASQSALALADVTASYSQLVVAQTHALLARLAERPGVQRAAPDQCDPLLSDLAELNPRYANVVVADAAGRIVCSGMPSDEPLPDVADMPWFGDALAATGPVVGPPHWGQITGVWVSVQALALRDAQGRPYAVVGVPLSLAALRPVLGAELPPDHSVSLVTAQGVVIARQPDGERWVGHDMGESALMQTVRRQQRGYTRQLSRHGIEKVYGFAPVPQTDWHAVAAIPSQEVLGPVWRSARHQALIAFGVVALAVGLALLGTRRLVRPVRAIGRAARQVGAGNLDTHVPVEGPREIAEVAARFNDMIARRAQAEREQARLTRMLQAVREVQQSYIGDAPPHAVYHRLLNAVLEMSGSPIGFVGEVLHSPQGRPYLQIHAISDLPARGEWRPRGGRDTPPLRFEDLDTLLGRAITTGAPVLVNDVDADALGHGLPPGHAPIRTFLGLPLRRHGRLLGMVGLANRPGGYEQAQIGELTPLLTTCAYIVEAYASEQRRRAVEARLAYLSQYDGLTGLPNRLLLRDRLSLALARAAREQRLAAVLVLDLDHFKRINDALGRATGDAYLRTVAGRLRAADPGAETVARLEGDDFAVVLENVEDVEAVADAVQRYQRALADPVHLDGRDLAITTSIGVSVYPEDGQEPEALLERAETAMKQAKRDGRNAYRFYTAAMQAQASERLAYEARLHSALERGEFRLHYQPQVDMASGQVVGVEALLRWAANGSLLPPDAFVPLAEDSGLIVPIGAWVLRSACAQVALWRRRGLPRLTLSVNVSPFQFRHADVPQLVQDALHDSGLAAHDLEIEITESLLLEKPEAAVAALEALRADGVQLAIDDFGTGYSSLSYLKRLPVHKVKIDRAFIHDLTSDPDDEAIVTAIIAMARNLNLTVIAEGVETPEQLALLKRLQCDQYQGYLFSEPVSPEVFEEHMRRRAGRGA